MPYPPPLRRGVRLERADARELYVNASFYSGPMSFGVSALRLP